VAGIINLCGYREDLIEKLPEDVDFYGKNRNFIHCILMDPYLMNHWMFLWDRKSSELIKNLPIRMETLYLVFVTWD